MKYLVLIGDMVESRQIENRAATQKRFHDTCKSLNRRRKHYHIVSPLMVTLGDEFQGVLGGAEQLWPLIARMELDMYPCRFRFSIGVGEITTEVNSRSSLGMDGPAFYHAREGMSMLRKSGGRYRITGLDPDDEVFQHVLELLSSIREKWNYNRLATFTQLLEGATVAEIAEELDLTEQAVYRTRRDGDLPVITNLLQATSKAIDKVRME